MHSDLMIHMGSAVSASLRPPGPPPPGSSVHGILQARVLGRISISRSGDLPDPGVKPASLPPPALVNSLVNGKPSQLAMTNSRKTKKRNRRKRCSSCHQAAQLCWNTELVTDLAKSAGGITISRKWRGCRLRVWEGRCPPPGFLVCLINGQRGRARNSSKAFWGPHCSTGWGGGLLPYWG